MSNYGDQNPLDPERVDITNGRRHIPIIELRDIPSFDGTGNVARFINIADSLMHHLTEDEDKILWLEAFKSKLDETAHYLGKNSKTWGELKEILRDRFTPVQFVEDVEAKILDIQFVRQMESIEEYIDRVTKLLNTYVEVLEREYKVPRDAAKILADHKMIKFAIEGLDDPIKTTLRAMDLQSFKEASLKIRRLVHLDEKHRWRKEAAEKSLSIHQSKFDNMKQDQNDCYQINNYVNNNNRSEYNKDQDNYKGGYNNQQHCSRFIEPPNGIGFRENRDVFTYSHKYRNNFQRRFKNKGSNNIYVEQKNYNKFSNPNYNQNFRNEGNNYISSNRKFSRQKDDLRDNLFRHQRGESGLNYNRNGNNNWKGNNFGKYNKFGNGYPANKFRKAQQPNNTSKKAYQRHETRNNKIFPVKTNNINIKTTDNVVLNLFVDSGASIGIIKKSSLLNNYLIDTKEAVCLSGISSDNSVQTLGTCAMRLELKPDIIIEHTFHVVDDTFPMGNSGILGNDFLQKYDGDILYSNNSLKLRIPDKEIVSINMHTDKILEHEQHVLAPAQEDYMRRQKQIYDEPIDEKEKLIHFMDSSRDKIMKSSSDHYIDLQMDLNISSLFYEL